MTVDDLKHIFRHQLTPKEDQPPRTELTYELIDGNNFRLTKTHPVNDFEGLLTLVDNFVFDAYRADDTVVFIKPEIHVV